MRFVITLLCLVGSLQMVCAQSQLDSLKAAANTHPDDTIKVHIYLKIFYEYHRSNFDSALLYAQKAEDLSRQLNFKSGLANALYRQGTIYRSLTNYTKAEELLLIATEYFQQTDDSTSLLYATIDMARLAQVQNRDEEAITSFQVAVQLAASLKDKNAEARAENYLGQLFDNQKQYDLALEHFDKALKLVREIDFKPGISAMLSNIAEIYTSQQKYEEAFSYLNEALELKREMGDKLGTSRVLLNIASAHDLLAEHNEARPYYQEAFKLATELGQKTQLGTAAYGLAQNSFNLGNYQQALIYAQQVDKLVQETKDLSLSASNTKLQGKIYAGMGDFERSYELLNTHIILSDSLYDETKVGLINELEEKYQSEQKAKEIALLESENQLQSIQKEKRDDERNYLIAIAVVAVVLIGLIYNQYRIKQKANNKLRELDRMKTSFFENLSHEFRTPLSLIIAPIKEKIAASTGKDKKELQLVLNNAEKLLKQINELLDLAKLEAGGYRLNKSSIEVTKFFNTIAASFSSFASGKSITFHTKLPETEQWLLVDQTVLSQLSNNLLSNAFKFTKEGGEVHFEAKYDDEKLIISVKDNGIGIPKELQERVFNRFEQVDSPQIFRQGTGIGLALVKELTEIQGGTITLNSSVDEGSVFTLVIPAKEGVPQHEALESENDTISVDNEELDVIDAPYLANQKKVLLIEDNKDLRDYISNLLRTTYQVITAEDGHEGMKLAVEEIPDLVVSDVMMPKMDGIEFCKKLSELEATDHIPIILLSARADQQTKISGLREGAIQYITKPFEPEELKVTVENIIHQQAKLWKKYTTHENGIDNKSEAHPFVKKCEEIVYAHLDDSEFDMNQFAKEVGMSRMQLHRKLNSLTNMSSTEFIRYHRLNKAKQLLESGEHVSQVAYAVGFASLSYFSTSFKKQFGKSPSEYSSAS